MLVDFFHLGSDRSVYRQNALVFTFLLSAFQGLCAFDSTDSQNLAQILYTLNHTPNGMQQNLELLEQMAANSYFHEGSRYGFDVRDKFVLDSLGIVSNIILSIDSKLNVQQVSHHGTHDNVESVMVHDVRTDDIYDKLGDINDSINNLTNFFNGTAVNGSGVLNTNLFAILEPVFWEDSDSPETYLLDIYYLLYGHFPDSSTLNALYDLYSQYGSMRSFLQSMYSHIGYPVPKGYTTLLGDSFSSFYWTYWGILDSADAISGFGDLYYAEYGTYDIENTTIGISNEVVRINYLLEDLTNSLFSVGTGSASVLNSIVNNPVEYDSSTGKARNSSGTLRVVGDLAEDTITSLPMISTNIVSANTNAIVNLEDNGYNNQMQILQNATPETLPGDYDDVLDQINSEGFTSDFASVLQESPGEFSLSFDLSGFNLVPSSSSRSVNSDLPQGVINLVVSDVRQTTNSYVYFFCSFFECVIILYFGALIWDLIYQSGPNFFKG